MRAQVFYHGVAAGLLARTPGQHSFQYDESYLASGRPALSASLPLRQAAFTGDRLPALFDSMVSEGWLKQVQSSRQRIDPDDRFRLLAENGADLPGAITIELLNLS